MKGIFFTEKRLDAASRSTLSLGQALVIGIIVGGMFDKIPSLKMRIGFVLLTLLLFALGIYWADNRRLNKE